LHPALEFIALFSAYLQQTPIIGHVI
jgi:hypothetical protein